MSKLIIPIQLSELNLLLAPTGTPVEKFKYTGVNDFFVYQPIILIDSILPIYRYMFPEEVDNLNLLKDIVDTVTGIWQLHLLSSLGDVCLTRLIERYTKPGDNDDLLLLARRIKNNISGGLNGYDKDTVLRSVSVLMSSQYNHYYHLSRDSDALFEPQTDMLTVYMIYITMVSVATRMVNMIVTNLPAVHDESLNKLLLNYLDFESKIKIKYVENDGMLTTPVREYLGITTLKAKKEKLKNTKLRIIK